MSKKIKVLMVDDHPLILEGYKSILKDFYRADSNSDIIVDTALNCDEADKKIQDSLSFNQPYKVAILDISLPQSGNRKFLSGEDLGAEIRRVSPETFLIILTMYNDNLRLINLLKNLNPGGLLIKSDVTPEEFLIAFEKVLKGDVHYSQTITRITRKHFSSNIVLDEIDRQILFYLAEGIRTKDLGSKVKLSLAAIEKRKRLMKEMFEVESSGDLALINVARNMGFL